MRGCAEDEARGLFTVQMLGIDGTVIVHKNWNTQLAKNMLAMVSVYENMFRGESGVVAVSGVDFGGLGHVFPDQLRSSTTQKPRIFLAVAEGFADRKRDSISPMLNAIFTQCQDSKFHENSQRFEFSKKEPDLGHIFLPLWEGHLHPWVVWRPDILTHVMTLAHVGHTEIMA